MPISYNKSSWSDCSLPWLMPDIHVNSASLYSYSLCKCWKCQGDILKPLIVFQDMEDKISPVLDMKGGNMSASHRWHQWARYILGCGRQLILTSPLGQLALHRCIIIQSYAPGFSITLNFLFSRTNVIFLKIAMA